MSPPPPIDLKRADGSVACRLTAEKIVSAGGGRLMCRGRVKVSAGNALAECASLLVDPERGVATAGAALVSWRGAAPCRTAPRGVKPWVAEALERPPVEGALAAESLTVDLRSGDVECAGAAGCLLAPNADAVAGAGAENAAAAPLLVRAGRVQLSARAATGCCVAAHDVRLARLPARVPPALAMQRRAAAADAPFADAPLLPRCVVSTGLPPSRAAVKAAAAAAAPTPKAAPAPRAAPARPPRAAKAPPAAAKVDLRRRPPAAFSSAAAAATVISDEEAPRAEALLNIRRPPQLRALLPIELGWHGLRAVPQLDLGGRSGVRAAVGVRADVPLAAGGALAVRWTPGTRRRARPPPAGAAAQAAVRELVLGQASGGRLGPPPGLGRRARPLDLARPDPPPPSPSEAEGGGGALAWMLRALPGGGADGGGARLAWRWRQPLGAGGRVLRAGGSHEPRYDAVRAGVGLWAAARELAATRFVARPLQLRARGGVDVELARRAPRRAPRRAAAALEAAVEASAAAEVDATPELWVDAELAWPGERTTTHAKLVARGGRPAAALQLEQRLRVGAGTVGVQGTRGVGDGAGWALRLRLLGAE